MSARRQARIAAAVVKAYSDAGDQPLSNEDLYRSVSSQLGVSLSEFQLRAPVGSAGVLRSKPARAARWTQQTLKSQGLISRVDMRRGVWRLTDEGKRRLHRVNRGPVLVAFHTRLGLALWADARDAYKGLGEPIHLCLTSPPYPLAIPRAYSNPSREEYVDFICAALEGIVKSLAPGGSIVLNCGNDVFEPGTPARSLYIERLTIALHDRLSLALMDRICWSNPAKPPSPIQWASIKRVQLNAGFEFCLWFTNDPTRVMSSNLRVLEPHSERHAELIKQGGENRERIFSDGAYRLYKGSYGNPTAGRIPRNVITMGSRCASQSRYKLAAAALGLPAHGAPFPLALAEFFVRFLTEKGKDHLVVDPMAGSLTVGEAAEKHGCRWICSDVMAEYLRGGATRFSHGMWLNPAIDQLLGIESSDEPQQRFGFSLVSTNGSNKAGGRVS